jgi:hypothetical protein
VLDADDQLTPGALARDIEVLSKYADIGWTTSRVVDLLPDGSTVGFDADPLRQLVPRGDCDATRLVVFAQVQVIIDGSTSAEP